MHKYIIEIGAGIRSMRRQKFALALMLALSIIALTTILVVRSSQYSAAERSINESGQDLGERSDTNSTVGQQVTPERNTKVPHTFSFVPPAGYIVAVEGSSALHLVPLDYDGLAQTDEIFIAIDENPNKFSLEKFSTETGCEGAESYVVSSSSFTNNVGQTVLATREFCGFHYLDRYLIAFDGGILVASANYLSDPEHDSTDDALRTLAETLAPSDIHGRLTAEL